MILKILHAVLIVAIEATLLVGAYGGFLNPAHPLEFYLILIVILILLSSASFFVWWIE